MPAYRRIEAPGATIFFTVVTHGRRPIFRSAQAIELLRRSFRQEQVHHPFEIGAIVVLPDHLHTIWTLPPGDDRFSVRWIKIKGAFTSLYLESGGSEGRRSASRVARGERGIWQRRFWEHVIRDDTEYGALMDYIHWNPVKHGYATCPHAWPYSSFRKWNAAGAYASDWMCTCGLAKPPTPRFDGIVRCLGDVD